MDIEFCSCVPIFCEAWCSTCCCYKMSISITTTSSDTQTYIFAWFCEVVEEFTIHIVNESAYREFHYFIFCVRPMHELYSASLAVFSCNFFDVSKIRKGVDIRVSNHYYIASTPSIPTKWTSFCNTGLPSPRDKTITAVSSSELNIYSIDKHLTCIKNNLNWRYYIELYNSVEPIWFTFFLLYTFSFFKNIIPVGLFILQVFLLVNRF